jgi:hypothetical protein
LDKTGTETAGTDQDTAVGLVDDGPDRLKVGQKHPLRLVVRVTHVMAVLLSLTAYFATSRHGAPPISFIQAKDKNDTQIKTDF